MRRKPKLATTEAKLKSLLQSLVVEKMPHLVFVKDYEGRFQFGNQAMAEFYGCKHADELIGNTDEHFFPKDPYAKIFRKDDCDVINTKAPKLIAREQVHGFVKREGQSILKKELHWLSTIKLPLDHDGNVLVVGVSTFIDKLVEQESELIQLRRKHVWEIVARQIKHRMGNKIAAIETLLERVTQNNIELQNEKKEIIKSTKLLLHDLEKLRQAGNITKRPCRLGDILKRAAVSIPKSAGLITEVNETPVECIELSKWELLADLDKLVDCIHEMLLNSIRWSPKGNCIVNIVVEYPFMQYGFVQYAQPRRNVMLSVTDNGIGITESAESRVFDSDYTTHPEGSGLGLAIVKEIIEAHNGSICIGQRAKGACFVITLPIGIPTT